MKKQTEVKLNEKGEIIVLLGMLIPEIASSKGLRILKMINERLRKYEKPS